jgi:hypothetical protein
LRTCLRFAPESGCNIGHLHIGCRNSLTLLVGYGPIQRRPRYLGSQAYRRKKQKNNFATYAHAFQWKAPIVTNSFDRVMTVICRADRARARQCQKVHRILRSQIPRSIWVALSAAAVGTDGKRIRQPAAANSELRIQTNASLNRGGGEQEGPDRATKTRSARGWPVLV